MENNIIKQDNNADYQQWLIDLKQRYVSAQLKAHTAVNVFLVEFYWNLGKDIEQNSYQNIYGSGFFQKLSNDLQHEMPNVKGFSPINLRYAHRFYKLYRAMIANVQQPVEQFQIQTIQRPVEQSVCTSLFSIPWSHQCRIIDKCEDDMAKALFYVQKTKEGNWGRDMLLNMLDSHLYEREGKAPNNFKQALPDAQSDLAIQMTRDPYCFDFLTLRDKYNERELENGLTENVTRMLLEMGTGFSFMGRQVRIQVGEQEFYPDLLFYNARLHAYVVVELKVTTFSPDMLGQLSFYVSAVNHQMKTELDNPTIGLLICKNKDNVVVQYALDGTSQPIGISEYQLNNLYSSDYKSSLPSIEEIEDKLKD